MARKFTNTMIGNAPSNHRRSVGPRQISGAAKTLGCSKKTVTNYLKRRDLRVLPEPVEIELALFRANGNACAAARILGCTENWIVRYIAAKRDKGREIGRAGAGRRSGDGRISYVQIETPISEGEEFGEPYVLTDVDREMIRLTEEHFKEDAA